MDEALARLLDALSLMVAGNGILACLSLGGVALTGVMAWLSARVRSPGLAFIAVGFSLLALAFAGLAGEIPAAILAGIPTAPNDNGRFMFALLERMHCAFTVTLAVALTSLFLGLWYTYRRLLPTWHEFWNDGNGPL